MVGRALLSLFLVTWLVGIVFNNVEERGAWNTLSDANLIVSILATAGLVALAAIRIATRKRSRR